VSWSDNPSTPTIVRRGVWTDTPSGSRAVARSGGWISSLETVTSFSSEGRLSATISPRQANVTARFCSEGTAKPLFLARQQQVAVFGGEGHYFSFISSSRGILAAFGGAGRLDGPINDGLSAIVQRGIAGPFTSEGFLIPDFRGGKVYEDGLHADVIGLFGGNQGQAAGGFLNALIAVRYNLPVTFAGGGSLSASIMGIEVGSTVPFFEGDGILAASIATRQNVTAGFSSNGTLTELLGLKQLILDSASGLGTLFAEVTKVARVDIVPGFLGTGNLTSVLQAKLAGAFTGPGALSAVTVPKLSVFSGFTSAGVLAAAAGAPILTPAFSGGGNLTATVTPATQIAVNFLGGDMAGTLSATIVSGASASASFAGAGALSGVVVAKAALVPAFSGTGGLDTLLVQRSSLVAPFTGAGALAASPLKQKYPVAASFSGSGNLTATVVSAQFDFTDTFNRADDVSPGASWQVLPTYSDFAISSNMLVSTTDYSVNGDGIQYGPVPNPNMAVTLTMGVSSADLLASGAYVEVHLRSHNTPGSDSLCSLVVFSLSGWYESCLLQISAVNAAGALATPNDISRAAWNIGDTFTFQCFGDEYVAFKNGVVIGALSDKITNYGSARFSDSAYRSILILASGGAVGDVKIDQVRITELLTQGPRYITPRFGAQSTQELSPLIEGVPPGTYGTGSFAPTAVKKLPTYVATSEENTNRSNVAVPTGGGVTQPPTEYRVCLLGPGGNGGTGYGAALTNCGGGGGGGGGAKIDTGWRPISELGATYSTTRGTAAGSNTTFTSGSVALTARTGGNGGNGGNGTVGAAGTGGTATVTGTTATVADSGGAGSQGLYNNTSIAAANRTSGGAPGGSGGAARTSGGTAFASAKGGDSATAAGGAGVGTGNNPGNNGGTAASENAGGGGAGGSSGAAGTGGKGGNGGAYGAGAGGGAGGNTGGGAGTGAAGYTRVQFR
jgi:hypothetical protein